MELSTKLSITSDGAVMGFFLLRFGAFFEDKTVYVPSVCKIIHAFIWVAQRGIDNSAILLKTDYQFKGPLTENYVLQQFRGQFDVEPRYYSDKNSEIDFLIQYGTKIIPAEAKGGEDKSAPSFKKYIADRQPEYALRYSKRGYRKDGAITNLPLYLARKTKELLW